LPKYTGTVLGAKTGGYRGYNGSATDLEKAGEAPKAKANNKARDYQLLFDRPNPDGSVSFKTIAQKLNNKGVPTP